MPLREEKQGEMRVRARVFSYVYMHKSDVGGTITTPTIVKEAR